MEKRSGLPFSPGALAHLGHGALGKLAIDVRAQARVRNDRTKIGLTSSALHHEESHRRALLQTPWGLTQYFVACATTGGAVPAVLADCDLPQCGDALFAASQLAHEGYALAMEVYEAPVLGIVAEVEPRGLDREALELYGSVIECVPADRPYFRTMLAAALLSVCMESTLTELDLKNGVNADLLARLTTDASESPDERLVYISTVWQRDGAPHQLMPVLEEALYATFPGAEGNDERLHSALGRNWTDVRDDDLSVRVHTEFGLRLRRLIRESLSPFAVPEDEDDHRLNAYSIASVESLRSAGIDVNGHLIASTAAEREAIPWLDRLASFDAHYIVETPINTMEAPLDWLTLEEATVAFADLLLNSDSLASFVLWPSSEFTCVIALDVDESVMRPHTRVVTHRPLDPLQLVTRLGDRCLGVVTVDTLRDGGKDWSFGGLIAHAFPEKHVTVVVQSPGHVESGLHLEMHHASGPAPWRLVSESKQLAYFGTTYLGVALVVEVPTALIGITNAHNPGLSEWLKRSLDLDVTGGTAALTPARIWEHNVALFQRDGLLNPPLPEYGRYLVMGGRVDRSDAETG